MTVKKAAKTRSRPRSVSLEDSTAAVGKLEAVPAPPKHLNYDAREVWLPVCRYLLDRGTLHSSDVHVIEQFCNAISRAKQLQLVLDTDGYVDENGKLNPIARVIENVVSTIRSTSMLLGLAPFARQRMSAEVRNKDGTDNEENEWTRLLKR